MGFKTIGMVVLLCMGAKFLHAQTSLLDTTVLDKVGNKKNGFFVEALGASSVVGLYYERYFNIPTKSTWAFQIRLQGGFSPFTFFRFSFSDGVSVPMGIHFATGKRFKLGLGMMFLHSFFFQPIEVEDPGYNPVKTSTTQYKLFLQPQLMFEYHINRRFVGKLTFNPTFMPGVYAGKTNYAFMPWGGLAFGYKF
jgi:hypothetical protein